MSARVERPSGAALVPLLFAALALGVREATREREPPVESSARARPFVPPAFPAGSAPGALRVEAERSAARIGAGDDGAEWFAVEGRLRIGAGDALEELDLRLSPRGAPSGRSDARAEALALRGGAAPSRPTAIPRVRACLAPCALRVGSETREIQLSVTWLSLPDGTVAFHAFAPIDAERRGLLPARPRWILRGVRRVLGIDLQARTDA